MPLRLRDERQRRSSQTRIGRVVHIPQPTLSQIETGRLRPTPAQLQRLADFFQIPPEDLLKEVAS